MATKAERFRYKAQRSGPKKAKSTRHKHERGDGTGPSLQHNESARAAKHASYALEGPSARPSRKSTRKSANRQKTDSQSRMKRQVAEVRPESRPRPVRGNAGRVGR